MFGTIINNIRWLGLINNHSKKFMLTRVQAMQIAMLHYFYTDLFFQVLNNRKHYYTLWKRNDTSLKDIFILLNIKES